MCALDSHVRLECFIVCSIHLIHLFLAAPKKLCLPTLVFQKDGWSCGFQSFHITNLVAEHWGSFLDVPLSPVRVLSTMCGALLMLIVPRGSLNRVVMIWRV